MLGVPWMALDSISRNYDSSNLFKKLKVLHHWWSWARWVFNQIITSKFSCTCLPRWNKNYSPFLFFSVKMLYEEGNWVCLCSPLSLNKVYSFAYFPLPRYCWQFIYLLKLGWNLQLTVRPAVLHLATTVGSKIPHAYVTICSGWWILIAQIAGLIFVV